MGARFLASRSGQYAIVERPGPIITAPDPETAARKALAILSSMPGFVDITTVVLWHSAGDHSLPVPMGEPVDAPGLEASLLAMLHTIRRRKGRA